MVCSYHQENRRSHQNSQLKPVWAGLVLGWVISWEFPVTYCLWFPSSSWSCQCPCGCGTVVKRYISKLAYFRCSRWSFRDCKQQAANNQFLQLQCCKSFYTDSPGCSGQHPMCHWRLAWLTLTTWLPKWSQKWSTWHFHQFWSTFWIGIALCLWWKLWVVVVIPNCQGDRPRMRV